MSIDPVLVGPIDPDTLLPPTGTVDALTAHVLALVPPSEFGGTVDQVARDAADAAREVADDAADDAARRFLLPADGIPSSLLAPSVRQSLALAGTALQTAPVTTVAGRSGAVSLTRTDVGLGQVDNTSDAGKPLSTAATAALATKADLVSGLVPTSQLPALALTTAVPVASQAAMLALTSAQVQPGDIAVRTDGAGSFILTLADPSKLASWQLINAPTDAVTSVNGQAGTVVLGKNDVGLGNVANTSPAELPVSTATQAALDGKSPTTHGHTASQISDATSIGRNVLTATSQTAGRSALGITGTGADGARGETGAAGIGGASILPAGSQMPLGTTPGVYVRRKSA